MWIVVALISLALVVFMFHEAGVWLTKMDKQYGKGCHVIPAVFPRGFNRIPLPIGTVVEANHMYDTYMVQWNDNKITVHRRSSLHPADA